MRASLTILLCFYITLAIAQNKIFDIHNYSIKEVNGISLCNLKVKQYLVPDKASIILTRNERNVDSLDVLGVRGIENVTIKGDSFLDIKFIIRGGSGTSLRKELVICVSNNKIYKSLIIISDVISRVSEVYNKKADSLKLFDEREDYHAILTIDKGDNILARPKIHETMLLESKYDPSQNVVYDRFFELAIDTSKYFFYNSHKQLNRSSKIRSGDESSVSENLISAIVPALQLNEKLYLFIEDDWYVENSDGSLSCLK